MFVKGPGGGLTQKTEEKPWMKAESKIEDEMLLASRPLEAGKGPEMDFPPAASERIQLCWAGQ